MRKAIEKRNRLVDQAPKKRNGEGYEGDEVLVGVNLFVFVGVLRVLKDGAGFADDNPGPCGTC